MSQRLSLFLSPGPPVSPDGGLGLVGPLLAEADLRLTPRHLGLTRPPAVGPRAQRQQVGDVLLVLLLLRLLFRASQPRIG